MTQSHVLSLSEIEAAYADADIYLWQCRPGVGALSRDLVYAFGKVRIRVFDDFDVCLSEALDMSAKIVVCDLVSVDRKTCLSLARLRNDDIGQGLPVLFRVSELSAWDLTRLLSFGATAVLTDAVRPEKVVARIHQVLDGDATPQALPDSATFKALLAAQAEVVERSLPGAAATTRFTGHYGLDFNAFFKPKDEVGGDIWGVAPLDNLRFVIWVADFCGHDFKAGMQALRLADLMRSRDFDRGSPPSALAWINDRLAALLPRGQFAGMFYGVIDMAAGRLDYSCAAFPPPVIRSEAAGSWRQGEGGGLALGFRADANYDVHTERFDLGAGLLVYTDALVETPMPPYNVFEPEGVVRFLNALPARTAADAVNAGLCRKIGAAAGLQDDLTLLYLCRVASPA